jgi:membrane protease YdiL (CAAX protease family)
MIPAPPHHDHRPPLPRLSLWLMCAAMVLIVALKPDRAAWPHWNLLGWPLMAASLVLARRDPVRTWWRTCVLLAYTITLLWFTAVDGDTHDVHVVELTLKLGVGILVVPALLARYWLKQPLDYNWLSGRWSWRNWLWLVAGFWIAYGVLWLYFHRWTPDLHLSWNLAAYENRTEALWRIFWGCNFVGMWDELAFINFVFVLLWRRFPFWEANLAQAVFFTSFLYDMAFVGWGPVVIFSFALIQGYTYRTTRSLLYIIVLHLMVDTILFYMIANRWFPGWGWHP